MTNKISRKAVEVPDTDLLKDKECTTKRNKRSKKHVRKKHVNHPTILSRWHASESHNTSLSDIGWKEKKHNDRIALKKHIYVAARAERIGPRQSLNQRPDLAQAKRMQTIARRKNSTRQQNQPSQSTSTTKKITTVRKENSTTRLTLKQAGIFSKSRGESCRQLRHRLQTAIKPIGTRTIEILSTLQNLTICELFSELGPVPVAWRKTS